MSDEPRRVRRERRTISAMIEMYCRDHHGPRLGLRRPGSSGLCDDCRSLHEYAMLRIEKCPFCPDKPTCADCVIHCYKKDRREEVRAVMRYAGPRMLKRHPLLAVLHVLDGRRKAALPSPKKRSRPQEPSC